MASSSRRGARRDATASSASARAGPAAGADLEALVRELLELERFTERRERMLSRTQTRQLERHEREQRDAREREAIAARLARELTVSRERLERLERRERRRRETRARRVETLREGVTRDERLFPEGTVGRRRRSRRRRTVRLVFLQSPLLLLPIRMLDICIRRKSDGMRITTTTTTKISRGYSLPLDHQSLL